MKKTLIAILAAALVSTALADNKDDKKADDYWQFEKWLQFVHQEAPRHHLKLQWGGPTQEEFFYLYCWQSNNRSILHAIQLAKETWHPVGGILQVNAVNSSLDERLRRAKAAALKQFGEPVKGTKVDVRCKYDGGPSSIYVIALNHNQSDVNQIYLVIVSDELRQRKPAVRVTQIDTED